MDAFNNVLVFLHFIGLALGFSVSFGNMVIGGLIAKAAPQEKPILARFPPAAAILGRIGLTLLWVTGVTLVYTRWGGFGNLGGTFHAKLTVVVVLTFTVEYLNGQIRRAARGEAVSPARMQVLGKVALGLALAAVFFAVLTFE